MIWEVYAATALVKEERELSMRKVLLGIAIAMLAWTGAAAKTTVKVEQGLLDGTIDQGLTVYRGIPFAAPPVLRRRPPAFDSAVGLSVSGGYASAFGGAVGG